MPLAHRDLQTFLGRRKFSANRSRAIILGTLLFDCRRRCALLDPPRAAANPSFPRARREWLRMPLPRLRSAQGRSKSAQSVGTMSPAPPHESIESLWPVGADRGQIMTVSWTA